MIIHVVKPGDTLYSISLSYNVPLSQLLNDNQLPDPSGLVVGQTVLIQFPKEVYAVRPGDTLYSIANKTELSIRQLLRNNPALGGNTQLVPGQQLILRYDQEPFGPLSVNAYAYPDISSYQLQKKLSYLSELTPFTYGFTTQGTLIQPNDKPLIEAAKEYEVRPLLHLSTLTEDGNFSNELAHIALTVPEVQTRLVSEVLDVMERKGYMGLDVDFEFVYPGDARAYAQFVSRLRDSLRHRNLPVTVALAPKVFARQQGALYEGHDYAALSRAADYVLLMTYEWGYTYGPPMAVAPIRNVRQVVEYALTEMPGEQIYLGIPNYGYDWTLPFRQGNRARSISNQEAVELAKQYNVSIRYDDQAQAPTFRYTDEGGQEHEVWFEDARSIQAKLALTQEYGLHGAGYWNLMRPFPQNWVLLNALYTVRDGFS